MAEHETHERDGFTISTDPAKLDLDAIHAYLTRSYWAEGIGRDLVARSLARSICFGLYRGAAQIGLARVISDEATFAYLCDVYVLEEYRGRGLGKWLIDTVMRSPRLQGLRRWMLVTADAHGLYAPHGFVPVGTPENVLEIARPGIYRAAAAAGGGRTS